MILSFCLEPGLQRGGTRSLSSYSPCELPPSQSLQNSQNPRGSSRAQPGFVWMRGRQADERHRKEAKNSESGREGLARELEGGRGTVAQ